MNNVIIISADLFVICHFISFRPRSESVIKPAKSSYKYDKSCYLRSRAEPEEKESGLDFKNLIKVA